MAKNKKVATTNKNNMIALIIVIALFMMMVIFWIKRGTYAVGSSSPSISITCPRSVPAGRTLECDVLLDTGSEKILSVNANYDMAEALSNITYDACADDNEICFEIYANTENGFAIVNLDGVNTNGVIGHISIDIPSSAPSGTSYKIGLKNIEFSNEAYEMISADAVSTNVNVGEGADASDADIISRIEIGTTYRSIIEINGIENEAAITEIVSNDGQTVSEDAIAKTGDIIRLANGKEIVLSILGDLTGDGEIRVNDVGKLYRHLKNRQVITEKYILLAGDVVKEEGEIGIDVISDPEIRINDVSRLYRYVKGRITSLEVIEWKN